MINFIIRYFMPHRFRWDMWVKDQIEILERYPSPFYIGIPAEKLVEFYNWRNEHINNSKKYWRV